MKTLISTFLPFRLSFPSFPSSFPLFSRLVSHPSLLVISLFRVPHRTNHLTVNPPSPHPIPLPQPFRQPSPIPPQTFPNRPHSSSPTPPSPSAPFPTESISQPSPFIVGCPFSSFSRGAWSSNVSQWPFRAPDPLISGRGQEHETPFHGPLRSRPFGKNLHRESSEQMTGGRGVKGG